MYNNYYYDLLLGGGLRPLGVFLVYERETDHLAVSLHLLDDQNPE